MTELEELEEKQRAADNKKLALNTAGSALNSLLNHRTAAEILLKQGPSNQDYGAGLKSAAESVADPTTNSAKAMAYLKAKQENDASAEELDPNSRKSKAAKAVFMSRGKKVDPEANYRDLVSTYGSPADYEKFEFEEGERRKTAQIKGRNNAPKGFQYQMDPATGEMVLVKSGKTLPAETAAKIGNLLGAAKTSGGIESQAGKQPTGKWEALKDWGKEFIGIQDQDRANFSADVASRRNEVMNQIAGANVTADEKARVLEGIPTRSDAPEQFQGKARSTTDQIIAKAETEILALEEAGYDASGLKKRLEGYKNDIRQARASKVQENTSGSWSDPTTPSANAAPKSKYHEMSDDELARQYQAKFGSKK